MSIFLFLMLGFMPTPLETEVLNSPKDPGPYVLTFEEDLRFGGEEDEDEYYWADGLSPAGFTISPKGHIFVLDVKNSQILEFDTKGKFVDTFARKGQGPGEYQNLTAFQIFEDGSAVGFDALQAATRFSYYDKEMKFLNAENKTGTGEIIARPFFSPDGRFFYAWFMAFNTDTNKLKFKTGIFNAKRELIKEFGSMDFPIPDANRIGEPDMWVDYLAKQFETILNRGAISAVFLSDKSILVANAKNYTLEHWDADFSKQIKTIKKDYEPIAYTESDKQSLVEFIEDTIFSQGGQQLANIVTNNVIKRAIEKANIPPLKDPLIAVIPMEKNHFMVLRDTDFASGSFKAEIFNDKGKSIGTTESPGKGIYSLFGARMIFRNGFAYAMEKSEEGDNQIARYRYKIAKK